MTTSKKNYSHKSDFIVHYYTLAGNIKWKSSSCPGLGLKNYFQITL